MATGLSLERQQLTESGVAKAEWGVKRTCLSCGARFYDLQRESITCPACGVAFDITVQNKPRRTRATPVVAKAAAAPALAQVEAEAVAVDDDVALEADLEDDEEIAEDEAAEDEAVDAEAAEDEAEEEDGESAIEDVSELGDDDMADVIDTELDEEETDR